MGTVPYYYRTEKRKEGGRGTAASKITYRTFFSRLQHFQNSHAVPHFPGAVSFPCSCSFPPRKIGKNIQMRRREVCAGSGGSFLIPPLSHHCQRRRRRNTTQTDGGGRGREEEEGDYATSEKRKNCLWFSGGRERQRPFRRRSFSAAP